jgi:hypothetical protein
MVTVNKHRRILTGPSERDGLAATIECFDEIAGHAAFLAIRGPAPHQGIRIVRYEDLTGPDALRAWLDLLAGCDVLVPKDVLRRVLDTYSYSFHRISGGRRPGQEDRHHKVPQGRTGRLEEPLRRGNHPEVF